MTVHEPHRRTTVNDLVAAAREEIENLSPDAAHAEITQGDVLLIDVRDPRERERDGAIPGAKSVTRGMLEFWADPESPYYKPFFELDRRVIVFCAGGLRSALSGAALRSIGYRDVAHIDGGYAAWVQAGLPTERLDAR